jgi:secretion/DNA translocation related TadE-like protein
MSRQRRTVRPGAARQRTVRLWTARLRAAQRGVPDRGSASVWVLAVGLVMVAAGAAGSAVATAHLARQQARVAADFGALAGAARVLDGPAAACVRAEELARANGGRMAACHVDGLDLQVIVEVDVTPLPGLSRTARATARAGPVRG